MVAGQRRPPDSRPLPMTCAPVRHRGGSHSFVVRHKETVMLRRFIAAAAVLLFAVGLILADEVKGKITKIDTSKGTTITVKVDDKDQDFRIGKNAKVLNDKGDEIKRDDLKVDNEVTIKYEEVDRNGQKVKRVSEVKVTK